MEYYSAVRGNEPFARNNLDESPGNFAECGGWGEANLKRLPTVLFYFYKIFEVTKLEKERTD